MTLREQTQRAEAQKLSPLACQSTQSRGRARDGYREAGCQQDSDQFFHFDHAFPCRYKIHRICLNTIEKDCRAAKPARSLFLKYSLFPCIYAIKKPAYML